MNMRATYASLALLVPVTAVPAQDTGDDDEGFGFHAFLSGAQEPVPPEAPAIPSLGVNTDAAGDVRVVFSRDLSSLNFRLVVSNAADVTAAHLHCGRAGENGPVIVFLTDPNHQGGDVNGVLGEGTRMNEHIEASAAECETAIGRPVRNIASLAAAAAEGLIYANVHTMNNPAGEIRGQLILGDADDDGGDDDDEGTTLLRSGAR